MRFETSDNLIDLLVGQSLYSSPDAALRELLQNAQDACQLMTILDSAFSAMVEIKYSASENYLEVSDNGIGMDEDTFKRSFSTIGASTNDSPKLQNILHSAGTAVRPIGQFGIGILSCFGVAVSLDIFTRSDDSAPISVRIDNPRQDFQQLDTPRAERGTTIRLHMKQDGPIAATDIPTAVSRYVRHADNIWLEDVDSDQRTRVTEQWISDSLVESPAICSNMISSGRLQLTNAWDNVNHGLHGQIVLCNGGFLVSDSAHDILADHTIGFIGEFDVLPGSMTILMNREGFQKNDRWQTFCDYIQAHYQGLVGEKLDQWIDDPSLPSKEMDHMRAIQRAVLLIIYTPLREVVGERNLEKALRLLPRCIDLSSKEEYGMERALAVARKRPPLYVYRRDEENTIDRAFSDHGQEIRFTTPIRSIELRTTLLELNGYAVVGTENHSYSVFYRGRQRNVNVDEHTALSDLASGDGVSVALVKDAPAEHTRIGSSAAAEEITRIMELSSDLKIQSIDRIAAGVVQDYNGYILNADNDDIQRILQTVPDAVGNPIRKGIIAAYFSLAAYDITKAREILLELITDHEFRIKARSETGKLFREYLSHRIREILPEKETLDG